MVDKVEIKGVEILSEEEKKELNSFIEKHKEKLKWKTKSDFKLKLAIKAHGNINDKEKRKKYSISAEIRGETKTFHADAFDWNFGVCLHKIFNKLSQEVEHRFHSSDQNR